MASPQRVEALSRKLNWLRDAFEDYQAETDREIAELKQQVAEQDQLISSLGLDGMEANTPDKRALKIRKWLYQAANESESGKAAADKDTVRGILPNCHREQIYEAMRRAADGNENTRSGSSSLSAIQGIEYESFEGTRKNRVTINLEDLTNLFGSQILTTGSSQEGV